MIHDSGFVSYALSELPTYLYRIPRTPRHYALGYAIFAPAVHRSMTPIPWLTDGIARVSKAS